MYQKNGRYYYSPSDLTRYMESPFASWMDRYALEHPDDSVKKDSENPLLALLKKQGLDHEGAQESEFIGQGLTLVKIDGQTAKEKREKTLTSDCACLAVLGRSHNRSQTVHGQVVGG